MFWNIHGQKTFEELYNCLSQQLGGKIIASSGGTYDQHLFMFQWVANSVNDMYADAVLAVILQVESNPALAQGKLNLNLYTKSICVKHHSFPLHSSVVVLVPCKKRPVILAGHGVDLEYEKFDMKKRLA